MAQPSQSGEKEGGEEVDTRDAIMEATYRALRKHGYAGLSIQRIADEFDKSKSLLYYHYDDKEDLLVDFLDFMLDRFEREFTINGNENAYDQLQGFIDHVLSESMDEERYKFTVAMLELRSQAPHSEAYREQFTKKNRFFHKRLADIIRKGIEQGVFRDVDPDKTAWLLLMSINGAMADRVSTDDETAIEMAREALYEYIDSFLLTGENE